METSDVGTIQLGLEANASGFQRDIQNILNSTEGSVRSRAVRLGNIYRQQGMSQSSAMRRAWSEVRRTVSTSCNGMTRSTERATNRVSRAFSGIASKIATAFSVAVITAFTKKCIEAAASVNALNSQFEQTFGSMQAQAEQALQTVAKNSGIVQSRLQSVGTSIYAFAKTTGMDSVSALNMMQEALQVTADSAAYYDRSLEDTAESLKSFLKGNFENDAALGLSCTETTRNAAANKLYGKSFIQLSESQKQLTLLKMVKDANQLSGAMGQASREADGWENVTGNLKEAWKQFLAVVGQPILKVATQVVKGLSSALQTLTTYAQHAINTMAELFGWELDNSNISTSGVDIVAEGADTVTESLEETEEQAKKLEKRLSGFDELNVLDSDEGESDNTESTATSPVDTDSINSANNQLSVMDKAIDNIKGKLKSLSSTLGFDRLISNIQRGINSVNWGSIGSNFKSIMISLQPITQASFNGVRKVAKSSMDTLGKYIGGVISVSGKQLQTVTGGVAKWLDKNKDKISAGITEISDNISSGIDNIGTFYDSIFGTLGDSIDRMRPTVENAISTMLTGFSDFGLSVGKILSSAFDIATENMSEWAVNNSETIGTFFDNIQLTFSEVATLVGNIFSEISQVLDRWWSGSAAVVFDQVCRAIIDIGTTLMNVYNEWIQPVIDTAIGILSDFWEYTIKPIFENIMDLVKKVADYFSTLWNNILSPIVNWLVKTLAPVIKNVLNVIKGIFQTVFKVIGDVISGFLKAIGGVIDFLTNVFKGNWKKAFESIFDILDGILQSILGVIKGAFNIVIDALNGLIAGVYSIFSTIANIIGEAAGIIGNLFGQDWSFKMPAEAPLIPKLATGGIVKAPTLALVGDNAGANTGNPEVIAPLNKLQSMLNTSDGSAEDNVILSQILQYMVKIYELMLNSGSDIYELVVQLNEDVIFNKMIQANNRYKKRHSGKSAFV